MAALAASVMEGLNTTPSEAWTCLGAVDDGLVEGEWWGRDIMVSWGSACCITGPL